MVSLFFALILAQPGLPPELQELMRRSAAPGIEQILHHRKPAQPYQAYAKVTPLVTPVVDPLKVLTPHAVETLSTLLVALKTRTGVQMGVLVVGRTHQTISDYAQAVFEVWEGGSAERDDGILMVLALGDRRSRLHLGYGIEPYIPDSVAKKILDQARPNLKAGNHLAALEGIVRKVSARVSSLKPGQAVSQAGVNWRIYVFLLLFAGLAGAVWRRTAQLSDAERYTWASSDSALEAPPKKPYALGLTVAVWAVMPVVLMLVFRAGDGLWWGYPLNWCVAAAVGALFFHIAQQHAGFMVMWGVLGVVGALILVVNHEPGLVTGQLLVSQMVSVLLMLAGSGLGAGALRLFGLAASHSEGHWGGSSTSSSSSSSSWGSSSSSSSSWGSSSSSSSSWGSSSSSSSSWGGGGGSSGGGGASSSW